MQIQMLFLNYNLFLRERQQLVYDYNDQGPRHVMDR